MMRHFSVENYPFETALIKFLDVSFNYSTYLFSINLVSGDFISSGMGCMFYAGMFSLGYAIF